MTDLPTREENPKGLHQKYRVEKLDGTEPAPGSCYFVLQIGEGDDPAHVRACRMAAREYAKTILQDPTAEHLYEMARELRDLTWSLYLEDPRRHD